MQAINLLPAVHTANKLITPAALSVANQQTVPRVSVEWTVNTSESTRSISTLHLSNNGIKAFKRQNKFHVTPRNSVNRNRGTGHINQKRHKMSHLHSTLNWVDLLVELQRPVERKCIGSSYNASFCLLSWLTIRSQLYRLRIVLHSPTLRESAISKHISL
jgi:hypothetical protein